MTTRRSPRSRRNPVEGEWWGLQPPAHAKVAWGARAIYNPRRGRYAIDIVPNRQAAMGTEKDRKTLQRWLNTKGLKAIRTLALRRLDITTDAIVRWSDGLYEIEATPRGSHGYLYLVAYDARRGTEAEPMPPSDTELARQRRRAHGGRRFNPPQVTLTKDEIDALVRFRQRHGRAWKTALLMTWTQGQDTGVLRHLRNKLGPSGLRALRLTLANPRGRCHQPRASKGRYDVCPKGTSAKKGQKCRQPRADHGRWSDCK